MFGVIKSLHAKASSNKYTLVHVGELQHLKLYNLNFLFIFE